MQFRQKILIVRFITSIFLMLCITLVNASTTLDENCVINILNRTIQVNKNGGWSMPNIPSQMGKIRARATCVQDGKTISGQSNYFTVIRNGITRVGDIAFEALDPIPSALNFSNTSSIVELAAAETFQFTVMALYPDDSIKNITNADSGINYSSSNAGIAAVSENGLVTAVSSGNILLTARKDGALVVKQVRVKSDGDTDGDGLPDSYELANNLDPNDPIDASEDQDGDGLTALEEFKLGTKIHVADSDTDGISDSEETIAGKDGFITNPLLADTDGDGLNDYVEILANSSPTDAKDTNFKAALKSIKASPENISLTFNAINSEASEQLSITGLLIDGSSIDLTQKSTGTIYNSSNLKIASFSEVDGLVFAGQVGTAVISVENATHKTTVNVTIKTFNPVALSAITIPGYANNVDIAGDYAYVAAGAEGLQIVDVSDREKPKIVASLDTEGTAIDIRVLGNYAYIADGETGLVIINITDPTNPVLASTLTTAGIAQDIKVDFQTAYIANGKGGLEIIDVSRPTNPISQAQLSNLGNTKGVDIEGNTVVVVADKALIVIDASDPHNPKQLGKINIGNVKDVAIKGDYAYVAAYDTGYRVVNLTDKTKPIIVSGRRDIVPMDVELTNGFAFFAEQLFPNVVAFFNISDPENTVFQGTIDLSNFGDYAGTGIALDSRYAYITEERFIVSSDYKATGDSKLFIAQYLMVNDNAGIAPTVSIKQPKNNAVAVEGSTIVVDVDAQDDIAVVSAGLLVDDKLIFTDTALPYQMPLDIPIGATSIKIKAQAVDLGNNTGVSEVVTLTVQADADKDGLGDGEEKDTYKTKPDVADTDGDGLNDGEEISLGTNPLATDSDGDGILDKTEIDQETDPLNSDITKPKISRLFPTDKAKDIPENTKITLNFDEDLRGNTVNSTNIFLKKTDDNLVITGRVERSGQQVIITFDDLLADFTQYTLIIKGVRDVSGNIIKTIETNFTTGNFVDKVAPKVAFVTPYNNAQQVPINVMIRVKMSERIKPETVTEAGFYLYDQTLRQKVAGSFSVDESQQILTFIPNLPLAVGRSYRIYIHSIKDLFDNNMSSKQYYFTTGFDQDITAPMVEYTNIKNGQTGVSTDASLKIRFNEAISADTASTIILRKDSEIVAVTRSFSDDYKTVIIKPINTLEADIEYAVTIENIEDLSGNLLANEVSGKFTTGKNTDTEKGSIVAIDPYHNAKDIPTNAVITVQLSERVDPTTVTDQSFKVLTGNNKIIEGTRTLSDDGLTLTFTPKQALKPNATYSIQVSYSPYLTDLSGNKINARGYSFTTGISTDNMLPTIETVSILAGSSDVPVNAQLTVNLSEPVSNLCVNTNTFKLTSNGKAVEGALTLSTDHQLLIFVPTQALTKNTEYTLAIEGLCDFVGNTLAAHSQSFTTKDSDIADTRGATVQMTPALKSTDVAVNSVVIFEFDEAIDPSSIDPENIYLTVGSSRIAGSLTVNNTRHKITFTPLNPLPSNSKINTFVSGVKDLAGHVNQYFSYESYFETADEADIKLPEILAVTPNDKSMDIHPSTPVVITFSESLDPNTINKKNFILYANGQVLNTYYSLSQSSDNRTITFSNYLLPVESTISVIVTDDVKDLSGNRIKDSISIFTTSVADDGTRPKITTAYPGNSAKDVHTDSTIILQANESLEGALLEEAFHVSQNGVLINGTKELIKNDYVVKFTPEQPLLNNALIEVFLDSQMTDKSGNALSNYQAHFRTLEDPKDIKLKLLTSSPVNGTTIALLNPVIDLQFNKALDPETVTSETVIFEDYNGSYQALDVKLILLKGNRVLRIQPVKALTAGKTNSSNGFYRSTLKGISDLQGNTINTSFRLYTKDVATPDTQKPSVAGVSPPNGATNVGINAHLHWRFDEPMNPISFISETLGAETHSLSFSNDNQDVRYIPHLPFEPATEIKVDAPSAEDYAGNDLNPTSTTFTTQADIDTEAPTVIHINPANSATDVATNAQVTVEMSEPIDPISINSNTFYITDTITSINVAGKATLDKDGKTLHFIADKVFAVGRLYRISVSSIYDISGNNTYSSTSNTTFTTTFKENKVAPTIESSSIVDGQTEIPTNTRLRIRFNEPINELSIENISLKQDAKLVKVSYHLATDRQTVTLQPVNPLKANSEYQLTVENVEGISKIPLASSTKYSFITASGVDTQAGSVIEVDPYQNATGIPTNAVITVQLSERVDPTTVTDQSFSILTDNKPIEGARTLSDDGLTLTFTPKQVLKPSTGYAIVLSYSPYLTDLSGNKINRGRYSFTTGISTDNMLPTIETISILADSTDVPVNAQLIVNLSEPVSSLCVNANTFQFTSDGKTVEGALTLSTDHQLLTFVPTQALTKNTEYTLAIDGLCDFVGNTLAAHSQSFTTKDSDIADTRGATVTITPALKSTDVAVNSVIIFEFNEAIDPSSIDPEKIYLTVGSSRLAGSLTVNNTRRKITFTPLNPLPGHSKIYASVSGIKDLSGNLTYYFNDGKYFETADEVDVKLPEILVITPNDKSMDIHPSTPVVITFSESLDPNTINEKNFILYANGKVLNNYNYGLSRSSDNRTITFSNYLLPVESTISVIVTDDVKDLSGNRIKDSISIFTTSVADDGTRPKITTAYPGNSAKDVHTDSTIILQANESLDGALLEEAFHVSQNGVLINGTKELIKNDYVVKFTPEQPLLNNALIEVFLDSKMVDKSGNALSNYQTQFRTAIDPTNVKLKLLTSTPINQSTIGLVNPVIDLQFNKAVDPNTINKNTVTLFGIRYLYTGGIVNRVLGEDYQELEAKLILLKGNRVLRIQPVKALTAGRTGSSNGFYRSTLKGIADLQGNTINTSSRLYTNNVANTDTQKPNVAGVSPPNGATEVGINAHLHWRFDEPMNPISFIPETLGAETHSLSFSNDNQDVRYIPHLPFEPATEIKVDAPNAEDYAGNALNPTSTTFTTQADIDTVAPTVIHINPANSATDVATNAQVTVEMSEPIDPISVNSNTFYIQSESKKIAGKSTLDQDGKTLRFIADSVFSVGKIHYVYLQSIKDINGNITDYYRNTSFTTTTDEDKTAPTLKSTSIKAEQIDVPINTRLQVEFDEPINSISLKNIRLKNNDDDTINVTRTLSSDKKIITIQPTDPLKANSDYQLIIENIQDLSGNVLEKALTLSFTTESGAETLAGKVASFIPENQAVDVDVETGIIVKFNRVINPVSITDKSFIIQDAEKSSDIAGTRTLSKDGLTLTFTPTKLFTEKQRYIVRISYHANNYLTDLTGENILATSFSFTTK